MRRTHSADVLVVFLFMVLASLAKAQDQITGAFEGTVKNSQTGAPIVGAEARITSQKSGIVYVQRTDARGVFYQGQLPPGIYNIVVSMNGFETRAAEQRLEIGFAGEVVPVPVTLEPTSLAVPRIVPPPLTAADTDLLSKLNRSGAARSQSFSEADVSKLPLGSLTLIRSFDQLAQLAAGVAPPPQTLGSVAGPGQGAGVGSAGQFAVNGLRSRANNFTVDGSDNNDEDIGVRRQGFVALIPQPIESIESFQIITLLAPAQYGRNLGAQVNAVSKSGGNQVHGNLYGFFNASQLNARNFFDTGNVDERVQVFSEGGQIVLLDGKPLFVSNQAGGKDSFTLGNFGATLGGPIRREKTFYFLSTEGQIINATKEESFAVPTVDQRGAFRSGATGIYCNPFAACDQTRTLSVLPTNGYGDAIFSLFPFPNHRNGVYGPNTFTQVLPASTKGMVASAKIDHNFNIGRRRQAMTGRYNFTDDRREIPVTGGALFSGLRPSVRTQNLSLFLNGNVSAPDSAKVILNQVRFSYGRTRLVFLPGRNTYQEVEGQSFIIPSNRSPNTDFLLNARLRVNNTTPPRPGEANRGPVNYESISNATVEQVQGPMGQVLITGFSPIGVDVYNFPQRRVNNTYQLADTLTWRIRSHGLMFGLDIRRSELNSDLPRNARPQVTFNGSPRMLTPGGSLASPTANLPNAVMRPEDLAAIGAPSGVYLSLLAKEQDDARLNLRFYQHNFFVQDEWKIRPNLTLSAGLRYEFNTPPHDAMGRIERTFDDQAALDLLPCPNSKAKNECGLRKFIDGRKQIFDPDRNNIAPRLSLAFSPNFFGPKRSTVLRTGYGLYYDQILGAVVSQSRNVYPNFLTLNLSGLNAGGFPKPLVLANPVSINRMPTCDRRSEPLIKDETINVLNPAICLESLIRNFGDAFPSSIALTLPTRRLESPLAHHFGFTLEQQLGRQLFASAAYVGTLGRQLLRITSPNLGPNSTLLPLLFTSLSIEVSKDVSRKVPLLTGLITSPKRGTPGVGAVNLYETTASSRYNALQLQLLGRLHQSFQYQVAYNLSFARDSVSDVFDLAGAYALPQNSTYYSRSEYGPANFDSRHRLVFNFVHDFSGLRDSRGWDWLMEGLQLAGVGHFQTGQPFTVNSIFDINGDGNFTDRLNTTKGILATNDRTRPYRLDAGVNPFNLLAAYGQDGGIGRNTFRAGRLLSLDMAIIKQVRFSRSQRLDLRLEFFNLLNHANFGIPVRLIDVPWFGQVTNTITPGRRVQISLKLVF